MAAYFCDARVLEIACGTGYWTAVYAPGAASALAIDKSAEVLALARGRSLAPDRVRFQLADAYGLETLPGTFDSCFAGFWWPHVPGRRLRNFLVGLHQRLGVGARVMFLDNRYVEGGSTRVARSDADGNTYQRRALGDGAEHDVLKNFPAAAEVDECLRACGAGSPSVTELTYYWYATYAVAIAP